MNFTYAFTGLHFADDGTYPRVKVLATTTDVPAGMAFPRIEITLPLTAATRDATCPQIAAQALQTARQLLNESALQAWLLGQVPQEP